MNNPPNDEYLGILDLGYNGIDLRTIIALSIFGVLVLATLIFQVHGACKRCKKKGRKLIKKKFK